MTDNDAHDPERQILEAAWEWLKTHGTDTDEGAAFFDRFLDRLAQYEDAYGVPRKPPIALPEPSPWIEELREQLTLSGVADVDARRGGEMTAIS